MLGLDEIPFFAGLAGESRAWLAEVATLCEYRRGEIIVRAGEPGRHLHAVASGAVGVRTGDHAATLQVLGPGQIFGEMSLFSGLPVSATVVAEQHTRTWRMDGDSFLRLLDEAPVLRDGLTGLLIERLRERTLQTTHPPGLALVTSADPAVDLPRWSAALAAQVVRYAPGSQALGLVNGHLLDGQALAEWRAQAPTGAFLVIAVEAARLRALAGRLRMEDIVLELVPGTAAGPDDRLAGTCGAADHARILLGTPPRGSGERWSFCLPAAEQQSLLQEAGHAGPVVASLLRHVTRKEIGIALSSGAARGFAHAGALGVLEEAGIPIDFLSGVSMGGIVAVTVAASTSVREATSHLRELLAANSKVKDRAWLPRDAIYAGRKIRAAAEHFFGAATFADLRLPVAVVASDLAAGARVILDSGPLVTAVLATSAVPGFFPPVSCGQRLLADGAIVSRVPVEVLGRRRCGLRIAINVVGRGSGASGAGDSGTGLEVRSERFLGFRDVLSASWDLLGSWGSNQEARQADFVIAPAQPPPGGPFDFDRGEEMIAFGRAAAEHGLAPLREAVRALLPAPRS